MNRTETRAYYQQSHAARRMALFIIALASFLVPVALSATIVALPAIANDLQANAVLVSWVPTSYILGNMIALIPSGRLADRYGRKHILMLGSLLFVIATLLSGLADSIELLLIYRALQGMASGMIFSTALAIISSIFRGHGSGAALGTTIAMVYLGMAVGPLLGGWLTEHYSWHSVFFFQAPLALLVIAMMLFWLKGEWLSDTPQATDWIGTVLLGIWSTLLFAGIGWLPEWRGIATLLLALAFLVLFIRQQQTTRIPLINFKVVRENRLFSRSIMAAMFMYGGNYTLVFLLSLYLQYNRDMLPSEAGQLILFQAVSMTLVTPLAGRLSDRYPAYLIATAGCAIAALCFAALTLLDDSTSYTYIMVNLLLMGLGFALFSTPNGNAALNAVPEEKLSIGSALLNMARLVGNMMGTLIAAVLLAVLIGKTTIEPVQYDALLTVIHWAMGISAVFALLGGGFSWFRHR